MRIEKNFFLGLVIFYFIIFFSPNKIIYFFAYFLVSLFFYLERRNLRESIFLTLILSIFSEIGLAGSLFLMEPLNLEMGSGYWFTPMSLFLLLFFVFSFFQKNLPKVKLIDFLVFVFYFWNIFVFFFFPSLNFFYGLLTLTEVVIFYFLGRVFIQKNNLPIIFSLVFSQLVFQLFLGAGQFFRQTPSGLLLESPILISRPYGITAPEEESLFRIFGSFGHPNVLAAFLLSFLPFLFLYPKNSIFFDLLRILAVFVLVLTYSRASWFIFVFLFIFWVLKRELPQSYFWSRNVFSIFSLGMLGVVLFFLLPLILVRFQTLSPAFSPGGSMDVRLKLIAEGINLIKQSPLIGVGLNRSLEIYAENPSTEIFTLIKPSGFYRLHNTLIEISAETGLIGLTLMIFIIFETIKTYFLKEKNYYQKAAFYGFIGLLGISMFNPFFHFLPFRFFFFLIAIILAE